MLKNSDRGLISPFIVMDVMKAANEYKAAGGSVIHMEVGQPQTGAPSKVLDLAKKAMDTEHLGYTDALGILVLRKRISNFYQQIYGIDINPERVVITTGASGGLILAFLGAFNNGDLVGITSPGYPAYKNILQALDIRSIEIPVGPKSSYQINTDLLDKVDTHIDGLIISSPANPTGSMISSVEMQNVARKHFFTFHVVFGT